MVSIIPVGEIGLVNCADCFQTLLGERTHAKLSSGRYRAEKRFAVPPTVAMRAGGRPYCHGCSRTNKGLARAYGPIDEKRDEKTEKQRVIALQANWDTNREKMNDLSNKWKAMPDGARDTTAVWLWFAAYCADVYERTFVDVKKSAMAALWWPYRPYPSTPPDYGEPHSGANDLRVDAPLGECLRIVLVIANGRLGPWKRLDKDDLRQELLLDLLDPLTKKRKPKENPFDPSQKGASLQGWLEGRAKGVASELLYQAGLRRRPVGIDEGHAKNCYRRTEFCNMTQKDEYGVERSAMELLEEDPGPRPNEGLDARWWHALIERALWELFDESKAKDREALVVLRLYLGLDGDGGASYEAIGEKLDITPEKARSAHRRAMRILEKQKDSDQWKAIGERLAQLVELREPNPRVEPALTRIRNMKVGRKHTKEDRPELYRDETYLLGGHWVEPDRKLQTESRPSVKCDDAEQANWFAADFDRNYPDELPLPHLYPTAEGGVRAGWSIGTQELSLDVVLRDRVGYWHSLDLKDGSKYKEKLGLGESAGWNRLVELVKLAVGGV